MSAALPFAQAGNGCVMAPAFMMQRVVRVLWPFQAAAAQPSAVASSTRTMTAGSGVKPTAARSPV